MKKYLVCFLALCGFLGTVDAYAQMHALIMTIGAYQGGIPRLKGVARDVESARTIAHLLGVKDENILQFHDEQLDMSGMTRAFDELDKRVVSGDKVFIYYSGHGGRQRVNDPTDRCAESMVTVDGQAMLDAKVEERLKKLSGRTQKVIAMFDSCHSGGVTSRSLDNVTFSPKFWSKGGADSCEKPVNVITRSIEMKSRSAGSGGNNYVYIAAAKDNEVSLDQSSTGGLATSAWLACMQGGADADGSGGLSVEEIQNCAQARIEKQMSGAKGFSAQHIVVTGNQKLVMTLAPEQSDVPDTPVKPVVEGGAPATLQDIYNSRDDKRIVEITLSQEKLKIGKDKFSFSLRSSHEGYVYLLMAGSDGKTFDLLFPNKLDKDNRINAGETVRYPRPSWEVTAQGPAGSDHILAIVSDAPRDLSKFPLANAGPFSEVSASRSGKRGIQLVTVSTPLEVQTECTETRKRNLVVKPTDKPVCSDAYGAALAKIIEVE